MTGPLGTLERPRQRRPALFADRSDAELLELARAGWASAFAVLLHRHGPAVRSAVRGVPDPTASVTDVFLRAMRQLPATDASTPVRAWLLELAGADGIPDPVVPLSEQERDGIWSTLATRWPDGRSPGRATGRVRRAALVAALMGVSALVPALVLATDDGASPVEELRAHPVTAPGQATAAEDAHAALEDRTTTGTDS